MRKRAVARKKGTEGNKKRRKSAGSVQEMGGGKKGGGQDLREWAFGGKRRGVNGARDFGNSKKKKNPKEQTK